MGKMCISHLNLSTHVYAWPIHFYLYHTFLNGDLSPFLSFEYMRVPSHSRQLSCTWAVRDSFYYTNHSKLGESTDLSVG